MPQRLIFSKYEGIDIWKFRFCITESLCGLHVAMRAGNILLYTYPLQKKTTVKLHYHEVMNTANTLLFNLYFKNVVLPLKKLW